jgi:hypothetical protein
MPTLTLEIPQTAYYGLQQEASRLNKPIQVILLEWITEKISLQSQTVNDPLDDFLSQAGLSTKLGPELQKRALSATMSLDEITQIMTKADGLSLSEILMEQRTAKEW